MQGRRGEHPDRSSEHPGIVDVERIGPLEGVLRPLCETLWPASIHGIENLPAHDRFMVVANHSGMGSAELWSLVVAWRDLPGGGPRVAGMAHPAAFSVPGLGDILRGLGAVEATREGAAKARREGAALLVFPGGDHEAMRPFWQASRVDFAGREGWIRLAREHGLTVVPMAITGSHRTLPILLRSRTLAWVTGMRHLLGVKVAPLPALSLASMLAADRIARSAGGGAGARALSALAAFWATLMVPWIPARIGFHLLPPIAAAELVDPARDGAVYERVVSALEGVLKAR